MDTISSKRTKQEKCVSASPVESAGAVSDDEEMCRAPCDNQTISVPNNHKVLKQESENTFRNSRSYTSFGKIMKDQSRGGKRMNISKRRQESSYCQKQRQSPGNKSTKPQGLRWNSQNRNESRRSSEKSQDINRHLCEARRSRSRSCSPHQLLDDQPVANYRRGTPRGCVAVRRRFLSVSREFVRNDQRFIKRSPQNEIVDDDENQRSVSRRRWGIQQRSFDSTEDSRYAEIDEQRSFRNPYIDNPDFGANDRRWADEHDPEVPRLHDRFSRTHWLNRTDIEHEYGSGRQWKPHDFGKRYAGDKTVLRHREFLRTTGRDSDFYGRSRAKSPLETIDTGYQRSRWEDDPDVSSRLPVRNRLGWGKREFNSTTFAVNCLDSNHPDDEQYVESCSYERRKSRSDNFKSSIDVRSGKLNAIWRRTGRNLGNYRGKPLYTKYGRGSRFSKYAINNNIECSDKNELSKISIVEQSKWRTSSEADLECVVRESLSKMRRNVELSGPESCDDAGDLKLADKTSNQMDNSTCSNLEDKLSSVCRTPIGIPKLNSADDKCHRVSERKRNRYRSSRSLSMDKQETVSRLKNTNQTSREYSTELSNVKRSPIDLNVLKLSAEPASMFFDSCVGGEYGRAIVGSVCTMDCGKSPLGPRTPTCDEGSLPSPQPQNGENTEHGHCQRVGIYHSSGSSSFVLSQNMATESSTQVVCSAYPPPVCNTDVPTHPVNLSDVAMTPWSVQQTSTRFESINDKLDATKWSQSKTVVQSSQCTLPTVFRSDWPTAADQQYPAFASSCDLSVPVVGSSSVSFTPSSLDYRLVTSMDRISQVGGFNMACQSQNPYFNPTGMQLTSLPNSVVTDSVLSGYSDVCVYGDSPLLDEPMYNSPNTVTGVSTGSVYFGATNQDYGNPVSSRTTCVQIQHGSLNSGMHQEGDTSECSEDNPHTMRLKEGRVNRTERIADEVKAALKPFFVGGHIDKEEYKDIMRKAVPKISASRHVSINSKRICSFVAEYVAKVKTAQKRVVTDKMHVIQSGSIV